MFQKLLFKSLTVFFCCSCSCFLSAIWLPHGQCWATVKRGKIINPMFITAFYLFWPKSHWEPCNEVWSKSLAEHQVGFELGTIQFWMEDLNALSHFPLYTKFMIYWNMNFNVSKEILSHSKGTKFQGRNFSKDFLLPLFGGKNLILHLLSFH